MGKRGYPARYTRDEVLEAAVDLIDAGETLTMKRLADRLAIAPMTLYGYVASKHELLEGVAALVFDGVGRDIPPDASSDEQLRHQALAIHAIVVQHPGLAGALRDNGSPNPSLFGVRERMLRVLDDAGFAPAAALEAMGVLTAYAQGFAAVQASGSDPARVRQLPEAEFPLLRRSADAYAGHISDQSFAAGLDMLLAGLRAARG